MRLSQEGRNSPSCVQIVLLALGYGAAEPMLATNVTSQLTVDAMLTISQELSLLYLITGCLVI